MPEALSPIPQKSPVVDKERILGMDYLRWFRDVTTYIERLLNRYDNERSGIASLTAGSVIVAATYVTASTRVRLTVQAPGGTQGFLSSVVTAGVGFTITSTDALDTSTVFYELVEAF